MLPRTHGKGSDWRYLMDAGHAAQWHCLGATCGRSEFNFQKPPIPRPRRYAIAPGWRIGNVSLAGPSLATAAAGEFGSCDARPGRIRGGFGGPLKGDLR